MIKEGDRMSEHYKKLSPTIYEDIKCEIEYKSEKRRKARKSKRDELTGDQNGS